MDYTKGKWYSQDFDDQDSIRCTCNDGLDAHIAFVLNRGGKHSNAQLIVSAVNACISVNPENPLAVAESVKDLYEALKLTFQDLAENGEITEPIERVIKQAIAKAEGGK